MKIFIITEVFLHEEERVVAVFDSYEKARDFVIDNRRDDFKVSYFIDEWEVE